MTGISLGNDFNAELVALAGWAPEAVDPSTAEAPFLNPEGGTHHRRAAASTNVDTAALNALIQKYTPTTTLLESGTGSDEPPTGEE